MKIFGKVGRIFYGSAIAATGIQQFFFKEFFQILFPPFQGAGLIYVAYVIGFFLFVSGAAIALDIKTRFFGFALAGLFLLLFIFFYVPYELIFSPYKAYHLGLWINPLKELAYAGGALVIAGESALSRNTSEIKFHVPVFLEKLIPLGPVMFSFTMISFGVSHFYYTDTVQQMVPDWIPSHLFWTYFAAVALIGAGIAIIIKFHVYLIANLLGLMIFLWFILLHMPGALADPTGNNGLQVYSAFSALAFSGIALVIANGIGSSRKSISGNE